MSCFCFLIFAPGCSLRRTKEIVLGGPGRRHYFWAGPVNGFIQPFLDEGIAENMTRNRVWWITKLIR
jgi:hypothetical protein